MIASEIIWPLDKVHIFWEGHKNFAKSSTNFWLQYIQSKVSGRFRKILWPSQNIWTLSTYLRGQKSSSIEIPPHFIKFSIAVFYDINLTSQHSHLEVNFGLRGGILIDTDSGPLRYVLWCCGSICHQLFTFIQIGCSHNVKERKTDFNQTAEVLSNWDWFFF